MCRKLNLPIASYPLKCYLQCIKGIKVQNIDCVYSIFYFSPMSDMFHLNNVTSTVLRVRMNPHK